jgi:hypothetical protein
MGRIQPDPGHGLRDELPALTLTGDRRARAGARNARVHTGRRCDSLIAA